MVNVNLQQIGNFSRLEKHYKIAIFSLALSHPVLATFVENIAIGFEALGCEVEFINMDRLASVIHNKNCPWDFLFTCVGNGITYDYNDIPIYEFFEIPFISFNPDHPFYMEPFEIMNGKNIIHAWVDRHDLKYIDRFCSPKGKNVFLPHGAEINFDFENVLNWPRTIEVLVCNTLFPTDPIDQLRNSLSPSQVAFFEKIAYYSVQHFDKTIENCVEDFFKLQGHKYTEEDIEAIINLAAFEIDMFRRKEKKIRVVRSLLDAGIEVNCVGNGWETTDLIDHPLFINHGKCSYSECSALVEKSKILINTMPTFLEGSHERVFLSMMRGALCMTDSSSYLRNEFSDGNDIVFYDYENLGSLAEKIRFYLANDDLRIQITRTAFDKVKDNHTWLHRAHEIVEIYEDFI